MELSWPTRLLKEERFSTTASTPTRLSAIMLCLLHLVLGLSYLGLRLQIGYGYSHAPTGNQQSLFPHIHRTPYIKRNIMLQTRLVFLMDRNQSIVQQAQTYSCAYSVI